MRLTYNTERRILIKVVKVAMSSRGRGGAHRNKTPSAREQMPNASRGREVEMGFTPPRPTRESGERRKLLSGVRNKGRKRIWPILA